jgi:hypothetical protein
VLSNVRFRRVEVVLVTLSFTTPSRRSDPTVCIVNVNYKAHRVQVTTVPVKIMKGEAPNGLVHVYRSGNMDPGDVSC